MSILKAVSDLSLALKKRQWKVVTAESCTGGGLAYWLTSLPGSSEWFDHGFITYSNASKQDLLGVNAQTLEKFGAVSEQTAREMAEGALSKGAATLSIAVTGIAGPDGGSSQKPIGTIWFAWKLVSFETEVKKILLSGDRQAIREQAILQILQHLQTYLQK